MFARNPWQQVLLAACILDLCFRGCEAAGSQNEDQPWSLALEQFFGSIDEDGDGQIGQAEALQYIDANFDSLDIQQDPRTAAQQMSTNLDGSDSDATVSKKEVEEHLRKLLKGNRVTEWLKHSAQMPQYVQAFKDNSITSLDFPMLVADGGVTLETDLGVKSKLHKEQLTRALKRVILGIGANPGPPEELQCMPLSCESVVIRWQPPEKPGTPPLHKYKLERQRTRVLTNEVVAAPVWETANGDLDDEDTSWVDTNLQVGEYTYRITAWNALGWSEYAILPGCNTADASLSCPRNKCWSEAVCKASEQGDELGAASGAAATSWSLVWSLGGVALSCIFLSSQFLTLRQRQALLQNPVAQKYGRLLRMETTTDRAGEGTMHPAVDPDASIGPQSISTSPSQRDLGSPRLSRRHGSSPSLQDAVRASAFRQLSHNDSCKLSSRDGASGGSSPRRRSQLQATRMDLFFPDEVETYRGTEPQSLLPNLRLGNRGLSGEQEVVWLDDEGLAVNHPPVLEIPPSPHQTSRNACGFPGCEKNLHPIFNPKAAMTSHYCSICQNIFCQRHTCYSPHGRLGSCGMESKCICQICFDDLPRLTQERLERTNKLPPRKDLQPSTSEGSGTTRPEKGRRGSNLFGGVSRLGTLYSGQAEGSSAGGAGAGDLRQQQSQFAQSTSREGATRNWSLLRNAWQAAMQFQGAGRERHRRSGDEPPQRKPLGTVGRGRERSTH